MIDVTNNLSRGILSVPLSIVMDMNNVMHNKTTYLM